MREGEKDEPL